MSSRQEEKERRKQERLRLEREAGAREKRRRIVQVSAAALLAAVVIIGGAIAASSGDDTPDANGSAAGSSTDGIPLPKPRTDDLQVAVKAAGCKLGQFKSEGEEHVPDTARLTFKTNPPTSGSHFQVAGEDGVYVPGNSPPTGNWVHSLEHGRVLFQYRPGTPKRRIGQLETLFNQPFSDSPAGYHTLVLENNSRMPFAVAAVSWTRYVACERFTDRTFDALRTFREQYVDKAPEQVP